MQFHCSLVLPRDLQAVPTVRRFCRSAMAELGVERSCLEDIALALTEACTNVVEHSENATDFVVDVDLADELCRIRVTDKGGFRSEDLQPLVVPDALGERGRGLYLMSKTMDTITFEDGPDGSTTVSLDKKLTFDSDHPGTTLLSGTS